MKNLLIEHPVMYKTLAVIYITLKSNPKIFNLPDRLYDLKRATVALQSVVELHAPCGIARLDSYKNDLLRHNGNTNRYFHRQRHDGTCTSTTAEGVELPTLS